MIIGVILTIFLLTVFPVVFKQLKVTGYEVYTAKNVFERAWEIVNKLFQFGQIVRDTNVNPGTTSPTDYGSFSL